MRRDASGPRARRKSAQGAAQVIGAFLVLAFGPEIADEIIAPHRGSGPQGQRRQREIAVFRPQTRHSPPLPLARQGAKKMQNKIGCATLTSLYFTQNIYSDHKNNGKSDHELFTASPL